MYLFIFETESKWGRGKERRRERTQSRLCAVSSEPGSGLDPTDRIVRS